MNGIIQLREVVLEPVIGLETPFEADVEIIELAPISPASCHVPTRQLTDLSILQKALLNLARRQEAVTNSIGAIANRVLDGGFALISDGSVILEPMCCSDLGNLDGWREAASCQATEWQMLWIGHPWVSVRFDGGQLIISDLHESDDPVSKYAVLPDNLQKATGLAAAELEDFSYRLQSAVAPIIGAEIAPALARRMAGLS